MTYLAIVKAIPALDELKKMSFPVAKAKDIFQLRKKLESERVFFAEEERKLIEQFAARNEDGEPIIEGTKISFDNEADCTEYCRRMSDLSNTDSELPIDTVILSVKDFGHQKISPELLENLEGFVELE